MKIIKLISCIFFLVFTTSVFSCPRDFSQATKLVMWQNLSDEQKVAAQWIHDQSIVCMRADQVAKLVAVAYTQANEQSLDPHLMLGLMRVESEFNPKAVSPAKAVGLTQVIAKWHRGRINNRNLQDMSVSMEVGFGVYREYLDKSKGNHLRAMNMYSGGGGISYYRRVVAAKKQFQKALIYALFTKDPKSDYLASN